MGITLHHFGFLLKKMNEVKKDFEKGNSFKLRVISNDLIKSAAMYNDKLIASIVLISYSLHKLLSKEHIAQSEHWQLARKELIYSLENSIGFLKRKDPQGFIKSVHLIIANLETIDNQAGHFIQGTYDKARIKYASTAYYYGLSVSKAASLTGCDRFSLQNYIGITKQDENLKIVGIKKRLTSLTEALK